MRGDNYGQDRGYRDRPMGRNEGNPPNLGSARSDYGEWAYGGRLNDQGMDRGWWDRTSDEVSSWFGDDNAERRRQVDRRRDEYEDRQNDYRRREFQNQPRQFYGQQGRSQYQERNRYNERRDWRELRAGDVMTTRVATVYADDPVEHAARMMGECDCGAVPVVDWKNQMIGMITDRDITIRLVGNGVETSGARVSDCMTKQTFACHVGDRLQDCMQMMSRHKIRRVPVVDDRNRVVGIISQADMAQHAAENTGTGERRAVSDVVCAVSEPTSGSYS